jgi:hypothetical protein
MPGLRKALKRIGARKKAEKRKGDLMRPGKSATPDNPIEVKKGGRIKKKGSFPDLSGDGKTTMKDILIGRGVIKKGDKNMQKKTAMKRGGVMKKKVKKAGGGMMKKRMKRGGRAMKRGGGMMKPNMMGGGMMKKRMKRGGKAK